MISGSFRQRLVTVRVYITFLRKALFGRRWKNGNVIHEQNTTSDDLIIMKLRELVAKFTLYMQKNTWLSLRGIDIIDIRKDCTVSARLEHHRTSNSQSENNLD